MPYRNLFLKTLPFLLLACGLGVWGCQPRDADNRSRLRISVGVAKNPYSGLIVIAESLGYFKDAGIDIDILEFASGKEAAEGLMEGRVDVATASEFVFTDKLLADPAVRAVAAIGLSRGDAIVVRRDRGIEAPRDLEGKTVGLTLGTATEYTLEEFLLLHRVDGTKIRLVDLPPAVLAKAVADGEVDAVATWDPVVFTVTKVLGDDCAVWSLQNSIDYQWLLLAREPYLRNDAPLRRFLRALVRAEDYYLRHRDRAQRLVETVWTFEPESLKNMWNVTRLTLSLNQGLVTSLENQLQWKIGREGRARRMPNVLEYIAMSPLMREEPQAITILR